MEQLFTVLDVTDILFKNYPFRQLLILVIAEKNTHKKGGFKVQITVVAVKQHRFNSQEHS